MAKELKIRRGNATQHTVFTGAEGELTYNTDHKTIHAHDGVSTGGFEIARADLSNISNTDFASKATAAGISGGSSNGTVTGANANASYVIIGTDVWGLSNERRLQPGTGIIGSDGGAGGGYTLSVQLANSVSGPPSNLGSASFGASAYVARADHVHAMPTAIDVSAVPNTRVLQAGAGISLSNSGLLTANTTVSLSAQLGDLTNVALANVVNNDLLVYNGATSKWNNFSANAIGRLTVRSANTVVGTANGTSTLNFIGNTVTTAVDGTDPTKINITFPTIYDQEAIEDFVGAMVSGNTETGINVTYNDSLGKLNFDVNDFTITLTGDVQGTNTVVDLGNITINTIITPNAVALGDDTTGNYVATVTPTATPNGIVVAGAAGEGTAVTLALNLIDTDFVEGVQDIVGNMVSGLNVESGINVTYDDPNGKLNFDVNDPVITLAGAVTGSATMVNLGNVSITTTHTPNSVTMGQDTIGSYVGVVSPGTNGVTVALSSNGYGLTEGPTALVDIDLTNVNFAAGVKTIAGSMVTGSTQSGIAVTYNSGTGKINFDVNDPIITLSGAITGSATMTNLGNVAITTAVANDSITLGTHTVGSYVATVAASGSNGVVIAGSGSETAAVTVGFDLSNANFVEGVQDIVGTMVSPPSNIQNGITVSYDDPNGKLVFDVNDPTISLTGVVTGSAVMTNLGNVTITTAPVANSIVLGRDTTGLYIGQIATGNNGLTFSTTDGTYGAFEGYLAFLDLDFSNTNFISGIKTIAGSMVTGSTQSGIAVTYNSGTGKINFDVNDPTITLTGAVTGTATMTNLGNVSITAAMVNDAVTLGTHTTGNYVATVAASGSNGIVVAGSGSETAAVTVGLDLSNINFVEGVQDIVGTMISAPNNIQNGITVTYDDPNGKLAFQANAFTITLGGDLTGSATITNLASTTLTATVAANSVALGTDTTGNYIATLAGGSNGITIAGSGVETAAATVDLDLTNAAFLTAVKNAAGGMVTGSTQSGIAVTYNSGTGKINFDVNDPTITLAGVVTGSAVMTNLGNVSVTTSLTNDSVTLGTHTVGNYVANVSAAATSYGITSTGTGETAEVVLALNMADANFVEGVQDIVGTMISPPNNIQNGITVTYDDPNGKLGFQANPFTITLTGALTGSTTITNLASANLVSNIAANAVNLATQTTGNYVATVASGSNGITVTGSGTKTAAVSLELDMSNANFVEGVQDIVGTLVTNGTKSGISVIYNDSLNRIDFDVNDPIITLTGAVSGSTTMTNLGNVSITTTQGVGSVTLGTHTTGNYVATLAPAATSNGIVIANGTAAGGAATATLNLVDANFVEGVQDIVGTLFTAGSHTAITATYNDAGNAMSLAVQNGVVDAASLGTYAASLYPRKAEAATITNQWNFSSNVNLNAAGVNYLYFGSVGASDSLVVRRAIGFADVLTLKGDLTSVFGGEVYNGAGANLFIHTGNFASNAVIREGVEDYVANLISAGTHTNFTATYNDAAATLSFAVPNGVIDAASLGTFAASLYPRKAENAGITGNWTFTTAAQATTPGIVASDGSRTLKLFPSLAAGVNNGIVGTNDTVVAAVGAAQETSVLTLTTYSAGTSGIRITNSTVNVEGNFTKSGSAVLTALTGLQRQTGAHQTSYSIDAITVPGFSDGDTSSIDGTLRGWQLLTGMRSDSTSYGVQLGICDTTNGKIRIRTKTGGTWGSWSNVWTDVVQGSGSGLDADKLDSLDSTSFMRTDAGNVFNSAGSTGVASNFYTSTGTSVTLGSDNGAPLTITQPSTTTGDSFMTFLNSSRYGVHFGLDAATSDLFMGGYSAGTSKYRIYSKKNATWFASPLRAMHNMTGGGTVSYDGTNVKWSARFIIMANGNGAHAATSGYFDITMPTTGTITGVGGAANVTATTSGIPLAAWQALYYILPTGTSGASTTAANFRVASYTGALEVPEDWVLLALVNADEAAVRFPAVGLRLRSGETYSATSGQQWGMTILPDTNNSRNIGSSSLRYNTMYATTFNGTATSAQYADVAERYAADAVYEPGTVVVFGGENEITASTEIADRRMAGVISTDPAYMMNSDAGSDETHPYVALVGRVPCKVVGEIKKGDMLTSSSVPGHAQATFNPVPGSIIGKALQDHPAGAVGVIEIAVQRF